MSGDPTLVSYYSERASEYERVYTKPERQEDIVRLKRWLREILEGERVLEIACGTGYWTEAVADVVESIIATDINEPVLEIARSKGLSEEKITFLQADAFALEDIPGDFTASLAAFWWSHLPKRAQSGFVDLLHRRLGSGARVVLVDNLYVEGSNTPVSRVDDEGNSYQIRRLESGQEYEVLKNFPDEDELRAAIGESGTNVRYRRFEYYWCMDLVCS